MNAAAGGGSFVTVPTLIWAGLSSLSANMSSTLALYPGSLTSAWAYRRNIRPLAGVSAVSICASSLVGGLAGALLLLFTPSAAFDKMIPWLLLAGAAAFAFGGPLGRRLARSEEHPRVAAVLVSQLVLGVYGGYFGGAVGIMTLSVWSVLGVQDMQAMNAMKVLSVAAANTAAAVCFVVAGSVAWLDTGLMLVGGVVGGYLGAKVALRTKGTRLRTAIGIWNFVVTAAFFASRYLKWG
jgi:uncharacterized membrane protein YfcA